MIRKTRAESEIRQLLDVLLKLEVATAIMPVVERRIGQGRTRLTWPDSSPVYESRTLSAEGYVAMMSGRAYSAVLNDGAMLQISLDFLGDDLVGQRLAYLPCPYELNPQVHWEFGTLDAIEYARLDEAQEVVLRGPVRFDYDPESAAEGHPESHMTIGVDSCRIPITRPITLGHFVRFVFRHFYPYLHRAHDVLAAWRIVDGLPIEEVAVPSELHLHWRSDPGGVVVP